MRTTIMGKNVRAKIYTKNLEIVCRLCLQKGANIPIWDNACKYPYQIRMFCRVRLCKNDGLPNHICRDCSATLSAMEYLRKKSQECDNYLRGKLKVLSDNSFSCTIKEFNEENIEGKQEAEFEDEPDSIDPRANVECHFENPIDEDVTFPCSPLSILNSEEVLEMETNVGNVIKHKFLTEKNEKCMTSAVEDKKLCPVCGKILYGSGLNRHLENHKLKDENISKQFGCSKCTYSFHSKERLEKHMKYHFLEKIYPCDICGKKFKGQHVVNRHIKLIHEKYQATECPICHKMLNTKKSFMRHLETHSGEKQFECDTCKKRFTSRVAMIGHFRIHTGEKPFNCTICNSNFRVQKTLIEHIRLHTGEKPYRCPVCDKGFAQKANMKSHFKYNHKDKVFK